MTSSRKGQFYAYMCVLQYKVTFNKDVDESAKMMTVVMSFIVYNDGINESADNKSVYLLKIRSFQEQHFNSWNDALFHVYGWYSSCQLCKQKCNISLYFC